MLGALVIAETEMPGWSVPGGLALVVVAIVIIVAAFAVWRWPRKAWWRGPYASATGEQWVLENKLRSQRSSANG